jgi:N-acetylneuraminic acid mutarotase
MLCSEPPTIVRTGGSEVVGTLVRQNGTPVAGAVVHLDTAAYSSDTTYVALDSTITDSKGAFSFRRMHGAGFFSIYGDYHSSELVALLRALKDTASPTTFHKVDVGTHAMFPPGFISGKVVIDETSMTGTICYIPGTSLMAITGDDGSFVISGVPVDTYRVFFAYPDYLVGRDSGVIVKSGDTTDVGTILLNYDPNKGVPTPRSVIAVYDTLHGVVFLSWHQVHVSDLKGYIVYRGLNGGTIDARDTVLAGDTVFRDTIYASYLDTSIYTCQYEVAAFDSAPNYGNKTNPITIVTVPPSSMRTVFKFSLLGTAAGDTAEAGDTVEVFTQFSNKNNVNTTVSWYSAYPDSMLKRDSVNSNSGYDTVRHVFAASGRAVLYVAAIDDHQNSWLDSIVLFVRPRHVDAVSCDSTTIGITIHWNMSHQPDFAAYRLYRILPGGDSLLYTTANRNDTSRMVPFNRNGVFHYGVTVVDSLGRLSPPGKRIGAWIKNSPPVFANDTALIPRTASVGTNYEVVLSVTDFNNDLITLTVLDSSGPALSGETVIWTPSINDTGTKHIAIRAGDGFGGFDTLSWNVRVTPVNVCAWGDSMTTARFSLSATAFGGTLYAAGGAKFFNSGGRLVPIAVSTVEAYQFSTGGKWTAVPSLASPRYAFGLAGSGNRLFSVGGTKDGVNYLTTIDSLSQGGTVWDTAGTLPLSFAGNAVCAIGTKVYSIGGISKVAGADMVSDAIYEFDTQTGQCVLINYMRTQRAFHQAVVVNGKIYILGGLGGASSQFDCVALNTIEVFNPATNMIEPDAGYTLPSPRYYFGAAESNGKIYVIGGCSSAGSDASLSSIEEFDPAGNSWNTKADLPAPRSNFSAVSWQGEIYIVGGIVGGQATKSVVVFYP